MATSDPTIGAQNATITINGNTTVIAGGGAATAASIDPLMARQAALAQEKWRKGLEEQQRRREAMDALIARQEAAAVQKWREGLEIQAKRRANFIDDKGKPLPEAKEVKEQNEAKPAQSSDVLFGLISRFVPGLGNIGNTLNTLLNKTATPSAGDSTGKAAAKAGASKGGAAAEGEAGVAEAVTEAASAAEGFGIAYAAKKVMAFVPEAIGNAAERAGNIAGPALAGDNAEAAKQAGEGLVSLAGKIPVVGETLGNLGGMAMKAAGAIGQMTSAAVKRGEELSQYSGQLAGASAGAEVRALQRDLREAQSMGPSLSRLIDAQSRAEDKIARMLEPLKIAVINRLIPLIEAAVEYARTIYVEVVIVKEVAIAAPDLLIAFGKDVAGGNGNLALVLQKIYLAVKKALDKLDEEPTTDVWSDVLNDLMNAAQAGVPRQRLIPNDFGPFVPILKQK